MSEPVVRSSDGTPPRQLRLVGALHLGLAGVVNIATGVVLVYLGANDRLVRWAIANLDTYVSPQRLVADAELVVAVATVGALVVGATLVLIGAVTLSIGYRIRQDRRPGWWWPAGVGSAMNPLALPLVCIALVVLWMDTQQWEVERP